MPRIAVNNGYCFAGNAALFGCADFCIATRTSWIGMAGPAMIEGGGMGKHEPTAIGPIEVQEKNGVVDIVAEDEAHATALARQLLSYFQGAVADWKTAPQETLRDAIPEDRRWGYPVRRIIETIADTGSFLELQRIYGRSIITGFIRLEGKPVALIANDCQQLGGAVDATAAEKAARFLQICDAFSLPVLSLTDTPGFMVGPESEVQGAVRRMSSLFLAGSELRVPVVAIFLAQGLRAGRDGDDRWQFCCARCTPPRGPPASSAAWDWRARCGWASERNWKQQRDPRGAGATVPATGRANVRGGQGIGGGSLPGTRCGNRSGRYPRRGTAGVCGGGCRVTQQAQYDIEREKV